ncbi:meleagrin-like isoform X2 [Phasianus colchicus]|uniref:CYGN protein n=1 Tax=Phasianus colchicus TaxID=9054 RepID=A0A669QJ85_PHACC|nr:meleagrin-like isoform X2 [Phasianus colchicus]
MRFLCLVFAVLLLVSLAAPGYGQVLKYCPKTGYCSSKCSKGEVWARSSDCKVHCCLPLSFKWK